MALNLDNNLLINLGLASLSDADKQAMLQQIRETLEMRVGTRLAEQMSDAQLDEFDQFVQTQDDAGALKWLETNFPNYKDVVNEEFEKLQVEIKQAAPQIVANTNQSSGQAADGSAAPPSFPAEG